jgi:hypothetical protein
MKPGHASFPAVVLALLLPLLGGAASSAAVRITSQDNGASGGGDAVEERCGTPELTDAQAQALEDQLQALLSARPGATMAAGVVTIPVAVHVLRTDAGAGDVTDTQIANQIAVLNSAYAGTNFRFSLASTNRTNSTAWSQHSPGSAAESAMKSALAVNPATTLNFYICSYISGYLGYARFPWDYPESSTMHGVVILNTSLPGGSLANYNLGHTGTHEIGHFLGLYHTFQGGCTGSGDFVTDTPPEASPASGCPINRDTCAGGGLDPIHNYMDYSYDTCMTEFVPGQSTRVDQQVAAWRPTMLIPAGGPQWVTTTLPTTTVASLAFTPQAKPAIAYVTASPGYLPQFASRAGGVWTPQTIENLQARQPTLAVDGRATRTPSTRIRGSRRSDLRQLRYAKRQGNTWTPEPVYGLVQGLFSQTSDLTLDATGSPWIAFSDENGQVRVAQRNGASWSFETAGIGGARGEEYVNIAVGAAGQAAVSWGKSLTQELYCSVRSGPNSWSRQTVATSTGSLYSMENSLCLNGAGQPVVAYYQFAQSPAVGQLKVATRQANGTWTYDLVASNLGTVNYIYPQLSIDAAGNLHRVQRRVAGTGLRREGANPWQYFTMSGVDPDAALPGIVRRCTTRVATGDTFWDAARGIVSPVAGTSPVDGTHPVASAGTARPPWNSARMADSTGRRSLASWAMT